MSGSHEHHHNAVTVNALWIAFLLNLIYLIIEVVAGILTNSLVLLSDAGHMVSDVAALALALFVERLARMKAEGSFTFGYRRAPVLGAFGNALTLYIIVVLIFWEAWDRLIHPPDIQGIPVLVVGIVGLAVNGISTYWLVRSGSDSLNIKGAILHLLADALGSLGAIIAAIVMIVTDWTLIDPLISVAIGFLILAGTWPLLRDSVKVLLQAAPSTIAMEDVRALLIKNDLVSRIDDLHVWELNSGDIIFTATLIVSEDNSTIKSVEQASDELRDLLKEQYGIEHATFEWRTTQGTSIGCEEKRTQPHS